MVAGGGVGVGNVDNPVDSPVGDVGMLALGDVGAVVVLWCPRAHACACSKVKEVFRGREETEENLSQFAVLVSERGQREGLECDNS